MLPLPFASLSYYLHLNASTKMRFGVVAGVKRCAGCMPRSDNKTRASPHLCCRLIPLALGGATCNCNFCSHTFQLICFCYDFIYTRTASGISRKLEFTRARNSEYYMLDYIRHSLSSIKIQSCYYVYIFKK